MEDDDYESLRSIWEKTRDDSMESRALRWQLLGMVALDPSLREKLDEIIAQTDEIRATPQPNSSVRPRLASMRGRKIGPSSSFASRKPTVESPRTNRVSIALLDEEEDEEEDSLTESRGKERRAFESNDKSELRTIFSKLRSLEHIPSSQTLSRLAGYAADTKSWQPIQFLLDGFSSDLKVKSELVRLLLFDLYYLVSQARRGGKDTTAITSIITQLFTYVDKHHLTQPRTLTQQIRQVIRSKDKELIQLILVDKFPLFEGQYHANWYWVKEDIESAAQGPEGTLSIFMDFLAKVGTPLYAQAVEYINREDV